MERWDATEFRLRLDAPENEERVFALVDASIESGRGYMPRHQAAEGLLVCPPEPYSIDAFYDSFYKGAVMGLFRAEATAGAVGD